MVNETPKVVLLNRVPVIIPLFNAVEYTKQAVETLKRNTHTNMYEVIFVDNGSTDGTKDFLKQLVQDDPEHFRVVTNEENLGFAGGVNTGLRAIAPFKWEYVCIANNDLLFTPNWLYQLLDCIQHSTIANIGAVAPVSNAAGGSQGVQVGYKDPCVDLDQWATGWTQAHKYEWAYAGRLVGLCFLMTRKLFETVGEFDERFVGGMWEDNDYCLRAKLAGFNFVIDRSTVLHHYMNKTFQANKMGASDLFHSNKKRYWDKWAALDSPFEKMAETNYKARTNRDFVGTPGACDSCSAPPVRTKNGLIKKFVVAACRVKDGAQYMERTLSRISEFADEIVVLVSKLTTDNTKEICQRFPKVVLIEDDHDDVNGYAESTSRNRVLEMAYSRHPDWIWCFDHDEMPSPWIKTEIDLLTNPQNPEMFLWAFPVIQLWNTENARRMDGLWGRFWQGRMFRALPWLRIENSNSLIHCGSHPTFGPENMGTSLVKIVHYGNIDPEGRKKKYERYTKIDTDKDLNMVLGQWKDYYWQLYYGQPDPSEKAAFHGHWKVIPNPIDWSKPKYGEFFDRDAYRHVIDETSARLVPFSDTHTVSLCMLIHNEGNLIVGCLEGARNVVDEIVCVDTGCTDATPEIAEQMGAKVFKFPWNDNFSDARNFSLAQAKGDWILRLDPDEQLPTETLYRIGELVRAPNAEGYIFPIKNWLEDPFSTQNAQWALSETCRLFKNQYPTVKYSGLVHEELDDSFIALRAIRAQALRDQGVDEEQIKAKGFLVDIRRSPVELWHFGYLRGASFLDSKFDYYCKLGNVSIQNNPNDPRAYFTTAVHYLHKGDYEKAIINYQKTIELDPKNHMAHNDCGVIFWAQGRIDMAEKHFRQAMQLMDENTHNYHKNRVQTNLNKIHNQVLAMLLLP